MNEARGLVVDSRYCYLYADAETRNSFSRVLGYNKINDKKGYIQFALSKTNMIKVHHEFPDISVKRGMEHVDTLKIKDRKWVHQCDMIRLVLNKPNTLSKDESPLIIPHNYSFKKPPKDHQHKTFMLLDKINNLNVMLDCGTGKSFILLTSTEYKIQKRRLESGATLVSCPLSIIDTSWLADAHKFTNLKFGVLWSNRSSKKVYSEPEVIDDHGPRPVYCIGNKKKKCTRFWNSEDREFKEKLTPFDRKELWEKVEYSYGVAVNEQTGEEVRYGKETIRRFEIKSMKEKHIREMLESDKYDVYIINHDGVRIYQDILHEYGFDQVIVDESTKIKNARSKVYKAHLKISGGATFRYPMSGTPAPNGALDLWSQFYFADRGMTLEPHIKDYQKLFFEKIVLGQRQNKETKKMMEIAKYVPKSKETIKQIAQRLKHGAVRYRQSECLDLPPRSNIPRAVNMTPEQTKAYMDMEKELLSEFTDENGNVVTVEASTALVKALRLRQINSGFAMAMDESAAADYQHAKMAGEYVTPEQLKSVRKITEFAVNPKMEMLKSIVDEIGDNKVVVITNYQYEIDMILKKFQYCNPDFIDGRKKANLRPDVVRRFQNDPDMRMICLHPQAAGHGITLHAAKYMVFFSMTNNYEHEYQVAKRIERLGQENKMMMYYLQGLLDPTVVFKKGQTYTRELLETIDMTLYRLIREKEKVQETLIDKEASDMDFNFNDRLYFEVLDQIMRRHT